MVKTIITEEKRYTAKELKKILSLNGEIFSFSVPSKQNNKKMMDKELLIILKKNE